MRSSIAHPKHDLDDCRLPNSTNDSSRMPYTKDTPAVKVKSLQYSVVAHIHTELERSSKYRRTTCYGGITRRCTMLRPKPWPVGRPSGPPEGSVTETLQSTRVLLSTADLISHAVIGFKFPLNSQALLRDVSRPCTGSAGSSVASSTYI